MDTKHKEAASVGTRIAEAHRARSDTKLLAAELKIGRKAYEALRSEFDQLQEKLVEVAKERDGLAATIDRMAKEEAELAAGNVTLHDLAVRRGTLTAEFGTGLGAIIADQFYATLKQAGAENYIEMQFTPKLDASKGRVTVTVKWETGKTPHELRQKAEAQVKIAEKWLSEILSLCQLTGLTFEEQSMAATNYAKQALDEIRAV